MLWHKVQGGVRDTTDWDISTASYVQNFSVSTEETLPTDIFFKPDGTKMYIIGLQVDEVNEYDLSTAWDISTASYVQNFSVTTQELQPQALFFKPDGTRMYVLGRSGDDVNEYNLSTAWDISTASYQRLWQSSEEGIPQGLSFKPDGTKLYIIGRSTTAVNEYDLSTAWNVTTSSYVQNFSVSTEETLPAGLFFKPDGTKMYITGPSLDVNQYDLSTAWDISTASYVQNLSVATEENNPTGLFFKPDGTKMYIIGRTGVEVNEYDVG